MKNNFLIFLIAISVIGILYAGNFQAYALSLSTESMIAYDFLDNFDDSSDIKDKCIHEGKQFSKWQLVFNGYGCVKTVLGDTAPYLSKPYLSTSPKVSTSHVERHAVLVTGPSFSNNFTFELDMNTYSQQRKGSEPNPWEVGWVLWDYTDNSHAYYFLPKQHGWELGKVDPAYPGGQRFLNTGSNIKFSLNHWYHFKIIQNKNTMTVYADGKFITTFTDNERPYTQGKIGLYNEDAKVYFDNVKVSINPSTPVPSSKQTAPSAPTGLKAIPVSSSEIDLKWNTPTDNGGSAITGYSILRSRDGGATWSVVVDNTRSSATTYAHQPISSGSTYSYSVHAINSKGQSYASNIASAKTFSIPDPPTGLKAIAISSSEIDLKWNAPADDGGSAITGYSILRSRDGGATWSYVIPNTGSTATSYAHSPISSDSTYSYSIHAINKIGTSYASNIASAKTFSSPLPTPPPKPTSTPPTSSPPTATPPTTPSTVPPTPPTNSQSDPSITLTEKYYVRLFFKDGTAAYYVLYGSSIQSFVPNISSYSIIGPAANYGYSLVFDQSTLVQHKLGLVSSPILPPPPSTPPTSPTSPTTTPSSVSPTPSNSQSDPRITLTEKYYVHLFFKDGTAAYYVLYGSSIQSFVPNILSYSIVGLASANNYGTTPDQSALVKHKLGLT